MYRRAQSFIDYAMIVAIASAAIAVMSHYVRSAMNHRFTQIRVEMNESQRNTSMR